MISLLVAMDENNVIGYDNDMPWHLPNDLKYFKNKTTGHTIVMGRKTYESIGRALPNRKNVVLTRSETNFPDQVDVIHDLEDIYTLNQAHPEKELFVIGGGHLFKQVLPHADKLYITEIEAAFQGDIFFPAFSSDDWKQTSKIKGKKDNKNNYDYYFVEYERK